MKKVFKLIVLILIFVFMLSATSVVMATGDIGDDVVNDLQTGGEGVMGEGVMNTVSGLSKDVFNIVRYVVIAVLVIRAFMTFSQFSNAGDNPQLKAMLKSKLLWTAGGLVLALNFWNLYGFIAELNLGL